MIDGPVGVDGLHLLALTVAVVVVFGLFYAYAAFIAPPDGQVTIHCDTCGQTYTVNSRQMGMARQVHDVFCIPTTTHTTSDKDNST